MTRSMIVGFVAATLGCVPAVAAGQGRVPPPATQTGQSAPQTPTPAAPAADAQPTLAPGAKMVIIQRVLVKVNGEAFTQTDLERAQTDALAKTSQQVNVRSADSDAVIQRQLQQITPGIIATAIDDMLLTQRARELGYKMSDEQYAKFIDSIKADNNLTDDAKYKKALADQGLTEEQLRKNLEHEYLIQAVQQSEIMGKMQLTEQEAREYYKTHQAEFLTPAKVVLREILIAVPTDSSTGQATFNAAADEAARAKANAVRDRVLKGEDFAKVAAEVSDSPSKANGGLIGEVNVADMSDVLRPILEALKPGDVAAPLRTPRGYQILKLDSRSAEQPKPFEDVREDIGNKIYQQRLGSEQEKYLQKIRAQALIEWKDESLKDMYNKQMSETKKVGGAL
jgi:parvulin-like peptidyl-prolyl isomerase